MQIPPSKNSSLRYRFLRFGGCLIALFLSGAVLAGEPLEQRVQNYWTARTVNDWHTVYRLESAALPGGWLTPDQYKRLGGLPVRDVKILEKKIEGESAQVKIEGRVAVGSLGWMPQTLEEQWVLVNGEWYHQTVKAE
ncbi:MAG: hypothetical protein WAU60_16465 [Candidatus Competibacter denitrificans]|jgi:hypothetical protein|uniref:Uncharacterized protein n=1 Tax=Candidatus Competibacter denitrificans Run_A_D11 TaxID=1400863 RepID=W6MDB7_9GAMM|nr:hypothetical protein [Candidatus Competibacter denitrificans]CDI02643.1 exported hypothetical protein [Candidatus Competibacter denitrificans Run_A_D11]HAS86251.1 hypothetical protein [Candidatus Competibacteraceae bacterium]HRC69600.1 hypothetical protein [Candidatus Competibacter denitrificans]